MAETSIEWTDATWNPVAGCTILTAGCTNCYAMRMAARLEAMGVEKYRGLTRKTGDRANRAQMHRMPMHRRRDRGLGCAVNPSC